MIRLFIPHMLDKDVCIEPDEKQRHYLTHVMRLKEGERLYLFNGQDGTWEATYHELSKKKILLNVQNQIALQAKRKQCILCPAIIKKENMDFVLQKATELGVTDIYPMITDRTVMRQFNKERAKLIVYEACEQCERNDIPVVHEPQALDKIITCFDASITLVHLAERQTHSDTLSPDIIPAFLIGPEGGFTEAENKRIQQRQNVCFLHLGTTILRAETASIAILAVWQFRVFS